MTINYTTLLGLAQPVTGTESGVWGTVVNDQITALIEDSVANASTISVTAANVTLTTTGGSSNQARMSTLIVTGTPGATRNIVAPSQAKIYQVINQSDSTVVVKGAATTGASIPSGAVATVAWNGSDFTVIASKNLALISGLGTNVATALAVAVGSAGAVVVNGGALGTPASGTLTNASGLPVSTGISGLGTNVATALATATNAASGITTPDGTATLTNKRITSRVSSTSSASSVTPDIASYDMYAFTALATGLAINAPTGTPLNGDKLMFRIMDNGTAQTLTWNVTFVAVGATIPTTTTANKTTYVGCIYNSAWPRWEVVAAVTQA